MAIRRVTATDRDKQTLNKILQTRTLEQSLDPILDYRSKVVLKPWGFEFLFFQNNFCASWFLNIKHEHSTSMHCHPLKKTSLILLKGEALVSTFSGRFSIKEGDTIILERGTFHSTKSLSTDGIQLIEIESPVNKLDLIRFNDDYGRESKGYEGLCEVQNKDLEQFNYFYLENIGDSFDCEAASISLATPNLVKSQNLKTVPTLCILSGKVYCKDKLLSKECADSFSNEDQEFQPKYFDEETYMLKVDFK